MTEFKTNIKATDKLVRFKNLKYKDQRNDILTKILHIIGITETNNTFYSHILDEDQEAQKKIIELDQEIKKYFRVSTWPAFKQNNTLDRRYLSIVKSIIKNMGINMTHISMKMIYNNNTINTTQYILQK